MNSEHSKPPGRLLVDADACPVKPEIYRVAERYGWEVILVSNSWMRSPQWVELVVVGDVFDAADDWIADNAKPYDVVITEDIPLAARALEKGARALAPRRGHFDENTIGETVAMRELLSHLRDTGEMGGGPPPFDQRARSRFLMNLDEVIQQILRAQNGNSAAEDS